MTQTEIENIWNYYLSLENDLSNTSRYIEPSGQENVYSYEFTKLIILACTEIETIFKILCAEKSGKNCGNIGEYKDVILSNFPKIVDAEVYVSRWSQMIIPFSGWDSGKLGWWDAYVAIKHNRDSNFQLATYKNAVYSLSALYLLILYLAKVFETRVSDARGTYIISDYSYKYLVCSPTKPLPDFDAGNDTSSSGSIENTVKLFHQKEEPKDSRDGDIWLQTE
ncbi:MAG: hypothetical protein IK150_03330 [Lachnospiraceae bacterium]|nr:hypothetical protein [Lachnospiraceae bacterium]